MWTCPERVERGGYLVAFEGERMTEEEAAERGLLRPEPVEPDEVEEPARKAAPKRGMGKR